MAFDRSRTLESKLSTLARRTARKGKESVRFSAITADKREAPSKAREAREDARGWR